MSDERPDALLKSALEKIVYFEARAEQLQNDVASATAEVERLKGELSRAAQREIELRRQVAGYEVELSRSHREREEMGRMNDALRSERAQLIGKLIEASRIHSSDRNLDDEAFDLAGFISELRSAALAKQPVQLVAHAMEITASVQKTVAPALVAVGAAVATVRAQSSVMAHAQRFMDEGRLNVSEDEMSALSGARAFGGRTEETLFGFSVRELSAPDTFARLRAAERLRALGHPAAAPALATALHAETEPTIQVAMLQAFAEVASNDGGAAVVLPLLDASTPEVRIAALKALLALDPIQAGPHLSAAMKDADRSVRRRASLLALGLSGHAALGLGEQAIADIDGEVRALGALVLGAGGGERARELLLAALRDPDQKVRKSAAKSLSRILGEDISSVVSLDEPQRRREVRRLSTLPVRPVMASATAPVARREPAPVQAPAPAPVVAVPESRPAPVVATPVAEAPAMREVSEPLCKAVFSELRAAIRGRTPADLVSLTGEGQAAVEGACELLVARGQAVRRGMKFFVA